MLRHIIILVQLHSKSKSSKSSRPCSSVRAYFWICRFRSSQKSYGDLKISKKYFKWRLIWLQVQKWAWVAPSIAKHRKEIWPWPTAVESAKGKAIGAVVGLRVGSNWEKGDRDTASGRLHGQRASSAEVLGGGCGGGGGIGSASGGSRVVGWSWRSGRGAMVVAVVVEVWVVVCLEVEVIVVSWSTVRVEVWWFYEDDDDDDEDDDDMISWRYDDDMMRVVVWSGGRGAVRWWWWWRCWWWYFLKWR